MKVDRMMRWEEFLKANPIPITEDLIISLRMKGATTEDISYLLSAHTMPWYEINKDLEVYDNSHPRMDELKFVNDLCKKYNSTDKMIIKRISQIRKLNRFVEKENKDKKGPKRLRRFK